MSRKRREIKEINGILYMKCNKCGEFKEATNEFFDKNHLGYMGLQGDCKKCVRERQKIYAKNNREKILKNKETFRKRHNVKEYRKKYYKDNREKINRYTKEYNNSHLININGVEVTYNAMMNKIKRAILKLGIRPKICPICGEETKVEAHHPDYNKRNEIVWACTKCHKRIHYGHIECPKNIVKIVL